MNEYQPLSNNREARRMLMFRPYLALLNPRSQNQAVTDISESERKRRNAARRVASKQRKINGGK